MIQGLEIHKRSEEELTNVLKRLIYHGENNSALVIGPRGSGKTFLINQALESIRQDFREKNCTSDLIIIYLSGCLQNDDKSALLEITRQMQLENVVNGKVFGSFSDSFEFLLKSFRAGDKQSKPLIFIMDEFDLFTKNKTQLLLYTLLNTIQSSLSPMCLIGATCRIDVLDLLEKRIKSRFSHRQIYLFNEYNFDQYLEYAKYFIRMDKNFMDGRATIKAKHQKYLSEYLNQLFYDKNVLKFLSRQYDYDKSLTALKRLMLLPGLKLKDLSLQSLKDQDLEPVKSDMLYSYNLLNIDTKFSLLTGLSVLELTLIVVILETTQTYPEEPFTFDLIFNAFIKFVQKKNWNQQKHERQVVLKVCIAIKNKFYLLKSAPLTTHKNKYFCSNFGNYKGNFNQKPLTYL
jgi:origin recognition complex subunit 4